MPPLLVLPLCAVVLTCCSSALQAATVIASEVWVTYEDTEQNHHDYAAEDYDGHQIGISEGWKGGSVTISLEDGETLLSAYVTGTTTFKERANWTTPSPITHTIPLYSGLTGTVTGTTTLTVDVWKTGPAGEQNNQLFVQYYPPAIIQVSQPFETSVSFTIETSLGIFHHDNGGEGFTAFYPIPEPSTIVISMLAGGLLFFRRRRG